MNIIVCVKQVPDTTEIKIDPDTNTLIRSGVHSIVNPFDGYALEAAARIKDTHPDTKIVALSMGPGQAQTALKECLAIAADKAYLISDRAFGGSDTLATSYILSAGVKKLEELEGKFDMIFCGKQAIDGDTAQVGPELAEHLGLPQVTYALEAWLEENCLKVLKEDGDQKLLLQVCTPCLITFTKPAFDPRYPSIKRRLAANRVQIPVLGAAELPGIDLARAGLKGSPTKVKRTFCPERKKGGVIIREESGLASAAKLFHMLEDARLI
ncbi:MAG: electron transfer flavoprotein subunit beta/FixA family protein [Lachnospiraceae bacterium]|jgi:electron transfer flavoprotein alpha/beta subunit|nr:electron transfer flavoprotein subunit beta/FixA family protein [Lachnospiraceae bacterium]